MEERQMIFVFGSNLKGIHGAGAALYAREHFGAKLGVGEGPTGYAYALPTCSEPGEPLPLSEIRKHIRKFLAYAREHNTAQFQVTAVGTGIAGYQPKDIAVFFRGAPENVWLPGQFFNAHFWIGYDDAVYDLKPVAP